MVNPEKRDTAPKRGRLFRLESIRGFAAALVLLNHLKPISSKTLGFLFSMGQEAVIVFFLLSGFVIYYATFRKSGIQQSFRTYFLRRFRRIYPLLLICLGVTYALQALAARRFLPVEWYNLAGNLLMLQDIRSLKPGVWVKPFCGNSPLWSLSYEWWFYMMFYPISTALLRWPRAQKYVVAAISLFGFLTYRFHPNAISLFLAYFYIWWCGVELAREYVDSSTISWSVQFPSLCLLAGLTICRVVVVGIAMHRHALLRIGVDPVLHLRSLADAMAFLVVGIGWSKLRFRGFRIFPGPFFIIAPITYALYIFHVPVLTFFESASSGIPQPLRFGAGVIALCLLCYLLEVKLQYRINQWFTQFESPGKPTAPWTIRS